MHAQTAMIENGFVHLPEEAPWLAPYLAELTAFPNAKHDDQVDSTAQMLDWFKSAAREPGGVLWLLQNARRRASRFTDGRARTVIGEVRLPSVVTMRVGCDRIHGPGNIGITLGELRLPARFGMIKLRLRSVNTCSRMSEDFTLLV